MAIYSLTVTSELDKLAAIASFISKTAADMGMDDDAIFALQLAVDEACTNVMDYAYQGKGGQPVTVECCEEGGSCIVTIRDQGKPFDPTRIKSPDVRSPLGKRSVGGLGIYLMRKLMDDVLFRFDAKRGNELILTKSIKTLPTESSQPRGSAV